MTVLDQPVETAPLERIYKVKEVAELLKCDPASVYALCSSGALGTIKIGRLVRVRESDLAAFIKTGTDH